MKVLSVTLLTCADFRMTHIMSDISPPPTDFVTSLRIRTGPWPWSVAHYTQTPSCQVERVWTFEFHISLHRSEAQQLRSWRSTQWHHRGWASLSLDRKIFPILVNCSHFLDVKRRSRRPLKWESLELNWWSNIRSHLKVLLPYVKLCEEIWTNLCFVYHLHHLVALSSSALMFWTSWMCTCYTKHSLPHKIKGIIVGNLFSTLGSRW